MAQIILNENGTNPTPPSTGQLALYAKTDDNLYIENSSGVVTKITSNGTVTSVSLVDTSTIPIFTVGGSPITSSGTLTLTLSTESANMVLVGPTSGPSAQPTFRTLVAADIPLISLTSGISGVLSILNGGTGQTTASAAFNALSPITSVGDLIIGNGANSATRLAIGPTGQVLTSNGTTAIWQALAGAGTVTSVALADGSTSPIFSISGSPITGSGTLTETLVTQSSNTIFAGPTTGPSAQPTFRTLVSADIPNNAANTTGAAANITATSNSTLTTLSSLSLPGAQVSGNISGNATNVTGVVAIVNGGTGQTSSSTAFNALSPVTSVGDLIIGNGANSATRLAIGTNGYILTSNGTTASWAALAAANTALSNLSAVAVNASLIPGTNNSINLGSSTLSWSNAYFASNVYTPEIQGLASGGTLLVQGGAAAAGGWHPAQYLR